MTLPALLFLIGVVLGYLCRDIWNELLVFIDIWRHER